MQYPQIVFFWGGGYWILDYRRYGQFGYDLGLLYWEFILSGLVRRWQEMMHGVGVTGELLDATKAHN